MLEKYKVSIDQWLFNAGTWKFENTYSASKEKQIKEIKSLL